MFVKNMPKASKGLAFLLLSASAACQVFAQAEVVDSQSLAEQARIKVEKKAAEDQAKANSQLFYQMQIFQDEMMRMQGQLEEQSHQIRQLKQQRLDDYVSFDKRIAELQQALVAAQTASPVKAAETTSAASPKQAALVHTGNEQEDYKAAFQLLNQKKLTEAEQAFKKFIQHYPESTLLGNCYYWLGRTYLLNSDNESAQSAFASVINAHSSNKYVPDASLRLAKIKFAKGNKAIAKADLENLIARHSYSSDESLQRVVRDAREFLQTSFP